MRTLRGALPFILAALLNLNAEAQSRISTYAGPDLPKDGAGSITVAIDKPVAVVSDRAGGVYVASFSQSRVYRVSNGAVTLVAGTSYGFGGDGGLATSALFRGVFGLAVDTGGNLYIADTNNHRVRKVTTTGVIQTVAGTGTPGFDGDGGLATSARLQYPKGIAVDGGGNLYIADEGNNRIRLVNAGGQISTLAGSGTAGFSGDGGPPAAAQLNRPFGLALDIGGNLYIAEFGGHRIRKIAGLSQISTVVGTGVAGYSGDGGSGPSAQLNSPAGVALDTTGNLYIADSGNHRIRKLSSTGLITYVAGDGTAGYAGDGGDAFSAQLNAPSGVGLDLQGILYIADTNNNRIRQFTDGQISLYAGNGTRGSSGDSGFATFAQLDTPRGLVMDPRSGFLYFADVNNNAIRYITGTGVIGTLPAASGLSRPSGVAVDALALYIADTSNNRIRKFIFSTSIIVDIAGYGTAGYTGDGGVAINAKLNQPRALAIDAVGNLYIADSLNHAIRKISVDGTMSTVAGTGVAGNTGDGGPAAGARLNTPSGIAVDNNGNLFIADTGNRRIRKVTTAGTISTIAGSATATVPGTNGDGFPATAPSVFLATPTGVAVDQDGNVFISELDTGNVRVVTRDGVIQTAVGVGLPGFSGDGNAPTTAQLTSPEDLATDSVGNLYIADTGNQRIRKVTQPAPPVQGSPFTVSNRGSLSLTTPALGQSAIVGYAQIRSSDSALAALAIFSYRQNNVLISEAAVPATHPITAGRIYARLGGTGTNVNTGLAIANPNGLPAVISFYFTGSQSISGTTTIVPNGQIAAFLSQAPFNGGSNFEGSFTFSSSVPVAVTALRGLANERGEFLVTTLPVADLSMPSTGPVFIPHFAAGGGWTTEIDLINPTDSALDGTIQLFDQAGNPVSTDATDNTRYSLPSRGAFRLTLPDSSQSVRVGSIRVLPSGSGSSPVGLAIFSLHQNGITVTEAGVPSMSAGSSFHMYVETAGNFGAVQGAAGSIQTGIAIANLSSAAATVTITVDRLDGSSTGLTGTLSIPANAQVSAFLNQIPGAAGLPSPFKGVLRISSNVSISVIGLRGRYNERTEFLITTIPPVNESQPVMNAELYFPHIVDSGGYTTQFIFVSGSTGPVFGSLRLTTQLGQPLDLVLR